MTMSRTRTSESGFTLAAAIVLMTILLVFIAYTVPRAWSQIMARERDQQTLYAMKQYARAILEYQKRHGGLPTSLDQLKEARKPRFVRGPNAEILDPLTGKADWILVPPSATGGPINPNDTNTKPSNPSSSSNSDNSNKKDSDKKDAEKKPAANKDYVGPFVGVRPNKTGKSFLTVNGSDNYEDWTYTVTELTNDLNARAAALMVK
jgi:type II secretory pathway pseudopilin PulG